MSIDLPSGWEATILTAIGAPVTANNVNNLDLWATAEGGAGIANNASFNPFNTTLNAPGAVSINSVGVKAYPDATTGLQATISTIGQQNMSAIHQALKDNVVSSTFGAIVVASPWGTGSFPTSVAPGVSGTVDTGGFGATATSPPYQQPTGTGNQASIGVGGVSIPGVGDVLSGLESWITSLGSTLGRWLLLAILGIAALFVLDQLIMGGPGI